MIDRGIIDFPTEGETKRLTKGCSMFGLPFFAIGELSVCGVIVMVLGVVYLIAKDKVKK